MAMRGPRIQVGSAAWIAEERSSALQIAQSEVEEFTYSARNELDWLNEHMAGIFDENETNFAEAFKTPGKLRGKTPRTARKANAATEARIPLSDVFGTPKAAPNRVIKQTVRLQSPQQGNTATAFPPNHQKIASPRPQTNLTKPAAPITNTQDSGYYGSQDINSVSFHTFEEDEDEVHDQENQHVAFQETTSAPLRQTSPLRNAIESPEKTFQTAKEDQSTRVAGDTIHDVQTDTNAASTPHATSHDTTEPTATSPRPLSQDSSKGQTQSQQQSAEMEVDEESDDAASPSVGSSPIRPVVRKSSLNFASLPAREPMTAGKSAATRVSRTSHLDPNRKSYYNRPTGGKSLGNQAWRDNETDEDEDDVAVNNHNLSTFTAKPEDAAINHTKTYTQRLQDQINALGKSHSNGSRPSKSIPNHAAAQPKSLPTAAAPLPPASPSPVRVKTAQTTPGAFPADDEEDDDDWIDPPAATEGQTESRPTLPKSYSADIMEGIHGVDTIGQPDFRSNGDDTQTPGKTYGHGKSASVATVPVMTTPSAFEDTPPLTKAATIAHPIMELESATGYPETPSKSPNRSFRDSPLKQVKNKLSSILKSSKGLLASSAAISAEGKSSMMSPSTSRLPLQAASSIDPVSPTRQQQSPERPVGQRTRASFEREKEGKRREKEAKQMAEQMQKLDKAREDEREKARIFSKEKQRIATLENQVVSLKEKDMPLPDDATRPVRSSPRKVRQPEQTTANAGELDVEMTDASSMVPPASALKSGPQTSRSKDIKRPVRPTKDSQIKPKQAPTVIRVNTGSQHSQYHAPSASASNPHEGAQSSSVPQPPAQPPPPSAKASKATLHHKSSAQSLKGSTFSGTRPKALELAAKKREQDEKEAQRRRDAKADMEKKRAAAQEEQRKQEQQRRQEAERQKQKEREQAAQTEAKKNAQRQAAIEKAKQTRAPPPAVRSQPNGPPDVALTQDRPASTATQRPDLHHGRAPSRLNSNMPRNQDESARPASSAQTHTVKAGTKRVVAPESGEEGQHKRPPSRGGPMYQTKDAKRRRTSDAGQHDVETSQLSNIKGPPVRPSAGFKKDLPPKKSMFQNGYSNAPTPATRDLFKATVTSQHAGQAKATHPLDMAQISKGAIPFAPNPGQAGPASTAYKTPARPAAYNAAKTTAKSAPRSSPRFQNGEAIELPEIQTDDEDSEDDDAQGMNVAAWADSPDLRRALMRQETMDPSQIFGPPAALNMEEVFSKNKDRWHKFRARTSSANWSGTDRLTEDDIRKDLAARDRLRREGGWSYEMSKEMI